MEFGISQRATLLMKRIITRSQGIQLPNDEVIRNTEDGEGYEYLGILEADRFTKLAMKNKERK